MNVVNINHKSNKKPQVTVNGKSIPMEDLTYNPVTRKQGKQSRHWIFTINNPAEDGSDIPDTEGVTYMVMGREHFDDPDETKTPHYQGYVVYDKPKRLSACKKLMPRAFLAIKKGTPKQAADYCKKDGDYAEHGKLPQTAAQATQQMWEDARTAAKEGRFDDIPAKIAVRCYHNLKRIRMDNPPPVVSNTKFDNYWLVGQTGCGKSHMARSRWGTDPATDWYVKTPNKWYTGYKMQPTIIMDDMDPKRCENMDWYLKTWTDLYAYNAEQKNHGIYIRPIRFIFTSQYTIEQCFEDPKTVAAMNRRCKTEHLEHWTKRKSTPFTIAAEQAQQLLTDESSLDTSVDMDNELAANGTSIHQERKKRKRVFIQQDLFDDYEEQRLHRRKRRKTKKRRKKRPVKLNFN